jgi:hypothetical protein
LRGWRTVRHRGVRRLPDGGNPGLRILGVGWTEAGNIRIDGGSEPSEVDGAVK